MSATQIDAALIQAAQEVLASLPVETPVAWEEDAFTPPDQGRWAAVFMLPAGSPPVTLGVAGQDEHTGLMQIDINTQRNAGTGEHREFFDAIAAAFPAGKRLTYQSQCVVITGCSRGSTRPVGAFARTSISITWVARTTRTEV